MTFEILERTTLTQKTRLNPSSLAGNTRQHSFGSKLYGCKADPIFFLCNNRTQRFRFILCTITFGLQINSGEKVIGVPNKGENILLGNAISLTERHLAPYLQEGGFSPLSKKFNPILRISSVRLKTAKPFWETKSFQPRDSHTSA